MNLRVGELVEVRAKEDILATLDKNGRLDGLPFMPQMFQYCGKRFTVYKRAHKTCDFVYTMSSRWLANGVHLDLRCDGAAYGGCQHDCLLFWKEAWLKRVDERTGASAQAASAVTIDPACTEADVLRGTTSVNSEGELIYTCQGTELPSFTSPLPWWNMRQYVEDYTSGNASIGRLSQGFAFALFRTVKDSGLKIGRPLRWLYDSLAGSLGFPPYPLQPGRVADGQQAPECTLNLQPGELVRVKSYEEILATLDKNRKNRGLLFDAELVPYCGKVFRVRSVVTRFLDEKTRKIRTVKTRCVALESVVCESRYSHCRMICPRSILSWWREIWLERVPEGAQESRCSGVSH